MHFGFVTLRTQMPFGIGLAVVAGNQLDPMAMSRLALLVGHWVLARAAFLSAPQSMTVAAAKIAFAALLATQLAPRLFGAAKKLRNQALPLVLTPICVSSIAFQLAQHAGFAAAGHTILIVAVLLFSLLMLFMGGRLIAPTVTDQFYRQGGRLDARVQPRIEAGLIVAMAVAAAAAAFWDRPLGATSVAIATLAAGSLAAMRLLHWTL